MQCTLRPDMGKKLTRQRPNGPKNASTGLGEGGGGGGRRYAQGPVNGLSRNLSSAPDPRATRAHTTVVGECTGRAVPTWNFFPFLPFWAHCAQQVGLMSSDYTE